MSQSEHLALSTPTLSITNFDLPSLHLLHQEIITILRDTEFHLNEFYNDNQRAPLLLDSIEVLKQLSCIFKLITLNGAQVLSSAIEAGLQQLYDTNQSSDSTAQSRSTNNALLMDLAEAVMTFDRYIEFVLLTETVEPTLLLPVINKLYSHNHQQPIDESYFSRFNNGNIVIANPEQNFEPLSALNVDSKLLSQAYRSGLTVVLNNKDGKVTSIERQKIESMSAACAFIAAQSSSLFWQAANALVADIEAILPLNIRQKHTLIYLEQQFYNYLPIMDSRFADLVGLACQRDTTQAQNLCEQYAINGLETTQRDRMKRFLFGPNRQVIDTLNELVQIQINMIKDQMDSYLRGNYPTADFMDAKAQAKQIAADLIELSSTLTLVGLTAAAASLQSAAAAILQWQQPTPADLDHLLVSLMNAENAIIAIAESHTPGQVYLPLNNANISLHKLNSAYETLIKESRDTLAGIEKVINEYSLAPKKDVQLLKDLPPIMYQLSGAIRFLELTISATMLNQLAKFLTRFIEANQVIENDILADVADVLVSIDYYLHGAEENRPVVKQSLEVAQQSLSQLLAAS